jgi:hypothetical protein
MVTHATVLESHLSAGGFMSLPNYQNCEYSLFISYAHDDDEGYNGWVQALKDAIWRRLSLLNRDIPRLNLHLSGRERSSHGDGSAASSRSALQAPSAC